MNTTPTPKPETAAATAKPAGSFNYHDGTRPYADGTLEVL
jgi:hypothetical protein